MGLKHMMLCAATTDNSLIIELVNRQLAAAGLGLIAETSIGGRKLLIVKPLPKNASHRLA